ncbi:MAG TPA: hypothetical protein VGR71_12720 [Nitrospira sp.]|nr:hypothetical protein [Nitrospira sp.]
MIALLLVYLAVVFLAVLAKGILASPQAENALACLGILAALLYWLWHRLPQWMRKIVHRMVGRKGDRHGR